MEVEAWVRDSDKGGEGTMMEGLEGGGGGCVWGEDLGGTDEVGGDEDEDEEEGEDEVHRPAGEGELHGEDGVVDGGIVEQLNRLRVADHDRIVHVQIVAEQLVFPQDRDVQRPEEHHDLGMACG
jgi:hypothetical protein